MVNLKFLGYPSYSVDEEGNVYSQNKKGYLKPQKNTHGYLHVSLCNKGFCETLSIHRLVGLSYNRDSFVQGYHCHHKDGDIYNNQKDNLCWLSPADHVAEGWKLGQLKCKYTLSILNRVNICLKDGMSDEEIVDYLNVPYYLVQEFRTGKLKTAPSEQLIDRYERKDKVQLNPDIIEAVVRYLNKGLRDSEISKILEMPRKTVSRIRRGQTFKDCQDLLSTTPLTTEKFNSRLSKEDIRGILSLQHTGEGISSTARILNISRDKVKSVYHRKCYKSIIDEIADELACQASVSLKEREIESAKQVS